MARRFTHAGRIDTRDRGPFLVTARRDSFNRLWVGQNIAASRTAREASGFLDAILHTDDAHGWLSQTASDIFRTRNAHAEAACYDAGFDGGEFSGPEHGRMEEEAVERAEGHFFNYTGVPFSHAVRCRISEKSAYRLGF